MNKGIGGHQSAKMLNDEWISPKFITDELGPFDLDPCAPINPPWPIATKTYTINDNGLLLYWDPVDFVFLNPPYSSETETWLERAAFHNNCIVLIFARTETKMFFKYVWNKAVSILFIEGRLYFHYVDGTRANANSGAPYVLIAYGQEADRRLKQCSIKGKYVKINF